MQIYEWTYEITKIDYAEGKAKYDAKEIDKRQWIQAQIQFQRATMEYENRKAQFEATVCVPRCPGLLSIKIISRRVRKFTRNGDVYDCRYVEDIHRVQRVRP